MLPTNWLRQSTAAWARSSPTRGLGVLLHSLGVRSGLSSALVAARVHSTAQVAERVKVEPSEWLRAGSRSYLTYDPQTEAFRRMWRARSTVRAARWSSAPPMMSSMGAGFPAFSDAFGSGRGFGCEHWHGADSFTQAALPTELIATAISAVSCAARAAPADVSGYGGPTRAIAALYPGTRVTGFDYHDASTPTPDPRRPQAGESSVKFEVVTATALPRLRLDLITFFDSLHDIGDPRATLVRARAALPDRCPCWTTSRTTSTRSAGVLHRVDAHLRPQRSVPEDGHLPQDRWGARLGRAGCGPWPRRTHGSARSAARRCAIEPMPSGPEPVV